MSRERQKLQQLTNCLLEPSSPPGILLEAAQGLYDLLIELSAWEDTDPDLDCETQVANGVAICPRDAARCVLGFQRTTAFLRGVDRAVRTMRTRRPLAPVELLYAGCGPLAPLVLPLLPRYSAEELRVTLLEIHEGSLASATRLLESLGLSDRIRGSWCVDALEFQPSSASPWDVCVVEMLQMALEKEPQLAVTAHLKSQLSQDGILVPQRISLSAELADLSREFTFWSPEEQESAVEEPSAGRRRIELGAILHLDAGTAPALLAAARCEGNDEALHLPTVEIAIPEDLPVETFTPIVRTRLQVAPSIVLDDYDCGLTVPRVLNSLGYAVPGERLAYRYRLGERPGLEVRRVD